MNWGLSEGGVPFYVYMPPSLKKLFFMATFTKRDLYNQSNPNGGRSYDDWADSETLSYHRYLDDPYLAEIEQYKGKSWYDYLLTNPWLAGNQKSFSPNFWQSIGESFGDYSARDAYNANLASNRSQWLSEFIEKMRQQDYNDPLAQSQREQLAGINPDLAGNITPGSASENDQPGVEVPMQLPGQSDTTSIGNFAMSLLSNIMGMAQSIQSLKSGNIAIEGQELDNVGREIANNNDAVKYVIDQIAGQTHFKSVDDIDNLSSDDLGEILLDASRKIDYSRYSPRTRKLIKSYFGVYGKNKRSGKYPLAVETLRAELRNRYASAHSGAVKGASSPLFDEDFDTFLEKFSKIIGTAEYDLYVDELNTKGVENKARRSKGEYDTKYFDYLDPQKQSTAENNEADFRASVGKQKEAEESVYTELYKFFMEDKSWYSKVGLIVLPLVRNLLTSLSNSGFSFGAKANTINGTINKVSSGSTDLNVYRFGK